MMIVGARKISSALYFLEYASTRAFSRFSVSDAGKQSRLTPTIPTFITGMLFMFFSSLETYVSITALRTPAKLLCTGVID